LKPKLTTNNQDLTRVRFFGKWGYSNHKFEENKLRAEVVWKTTWLIEEKHLHWWKVI